MQRSIKQGSLLYPDGIPAISRGLSAAIPPEHDSAIFSDLAGVAAVIPCDNRFHFGSAVTPSGADEWHSPSGGVAALNPRLMAEIPSG